MIAKEKAKELVDKFEAGIVGNNVEFEYSAIVCALLCVDEILHYQDDLYNLDTHSGNNTEYWEEVKKEINLL